MITVCYGESSQFGVEKRFERFETESGVYTFLKLVEERNKNQDFDIELCDVAVFPEETDSMKVIGPDALEKYKS